MEIAAASRFLNIRMTCSVWLCCLLNPFYWNWRSRSSVLYCHNKLQNTENNKLLLSFAKNSGMEAGMLDNKKKDMTPFDMSKKPVKQYPFLLPLIWGGAWLMTRSLGLKIEKAGMERIKPPYLVLSTHQGFSDYYIAPLALFPHRANYVSDMEGFAAFGEWLYRGIGCIGKRRYVSDIAVVKNIYTALHKNRQIVAVFPESRHSNAGTTAYIPQNMGKLAKLMKVPVVMLSSMEVIWQGLFGMRHTPGRCRCGQSWNAFIRKKSWRRQRKKLFSKK